MSYKMNTRRKLAIASHSSPSEGNIYGTLTVDMTETLNYLEHLRQITGEKITITHFVGRTVGQVLAEATDLNGRIFLGAFRPHKTVDVSFLVTLEGGNDLAKVKICEIDKKTTVQIAREIKEGATRLRQGRDEEFNKSKPLLKLLPTWLIRPMLWLTGYLTSAAGISIKALGLQAYPFGTCIVTSIGMFGVDGAFAPPTPFCRVPVYVVVTTVQDRVVVVDKKIVIRPQLDLSFTVDHRFVDGHQGAILSRIIRRAFENPWAVDGVERPGVKHADVSATV